jgi:hypothetical protein
MAGAVGLVVVAVVAAMAIERAQRPPRLQHPDLPGIDVSGLDAEQLQAFLAESKRLPCKCGCGFTLADCRHKDPTCSHSRPVLTRMVREYRKRVATTDVSNE